MDGSTSACISLVSGGMDGSARRKKKETMAAHLPWVVLDRIPRLVALTGRSRSGEADDVMFDFHKPPRPSLCKLRRSLFEGSRPEVRICAVDHTGCFVVSAADPATNQREAGATAASPTDPASQSEDHHRLLFCDGTAGTARLLPVAPVALRRASVGILANAAGRRVVAALHHPEGTHDASIFFCDPSIDSTTWDHVAVAYPPGGQPPWNATSVVCHLTRIYWVDPALGILYFDPFVDTSRVLYVPHPPGSDAHATSEGSRLLQLSRGKMRCVQLEGAGEATIIKVWTLCEDSSEGQVHWKPGFEIPLSQLNHDELVTTEIAKIVYMHPNIPTIVSLLSLAGSVFEVDLVAGGTAVHQNIPWYAQETSVVTVNFNSNLMPWSAVLAQPRVLSATSQFCATQLDKKGEAPQPSILNFATEMPNHYKTTSCYVSAVDTNSGSLLIYEQRERRARSKKWTFQSYSILHSDDSFQKLPILPDMVEWHHNNAGIIVNPSNGDIFVGLLNLQHQTLYFWTSDSPNTWRKISISAESPNGYFWIGHGAHALDSALFWVDLRVGFLTCNAFTAKRNQLKFISLPKKSVLPEDVSFPLNRFRCVSVTFGTIRFVDTDFIDGFPSVKLWSFVTDEADWSLEYTVEFSKLTKKMSSVGFLHPWILSKIYFLQHEKAFAVESTENDQEECEFKVASPPKEYRASLVHICNIPIKSLTHFPAYLAPAFFFRKRAQHVLH